MTVREATTFPEIHPVAHELAAILQFGRMASQKTARSVGKDGSRTSGSDNDPKNIKGHCQTVGSTRDRSDRATEECKEQG